MTTATCAKCGVPSELCESVKSNGIKQPRMCKPCLVAAMSNGDWDAVDEYWIKQLTELRDTESLKAILAQSQEDN